VKLKHLTLRGFKSFADRTRLDFASGVNVVVGPNGSGKSNIVDAIAWVMGTQATKTLRTEKMEDVVFAGTATRPALSRAEVQLTFQNDDRIMPLDLAEITVTRRLFRDGTSEYELNGAPCRLLDIQDLLSDGGIGRQQHVLVGQGQVGDVLNASAQDHRAVIEEAAGVTKHRSRRDRATRRLERTDQDIERLNDILGEQRRLLRPLKRQANAALRYDSVRDESLAIRLFLGGEELRSIRTRFEGASKEHETALIGRDLADTELTELLARLEGLRAKAGEVGASLTRDTAAAARLETVKERLDRIASVARERIRSSEAQMDGADERREDLLLERDDLETAIVEASDFELVVSDRSDRKEAELLALEDEERSLAEQIQLPSEGVVANLRGDLRALETADRRDDAERVQIETRMSVVAERLVEESTEIERLNDAIRKTDSQTHPLQNEYEAASKRRGDAQTQWEAASSAHAEQRLTVAAGEARVDALETAMAGLFDEGVRARAEAAEGITGTLVARLDVPSDMAQAVDAALGSWRHAYVADTGDAMIAAVSDVKGAGAGGVAFVTANAESRFDASGAAEAFGVDLLIDRLGPGADMSAAHTLLGDVVVVEGWQTAHRITAAHPMIRAVTPEGDVISAIGMSVAQPDGAGPAALEAAAVDLEIAERELQRTQSLSVSAQRSFDSSRSQERSALEALEAVEAELAGHTEALGLLERARTASLGEGERLSSRIEAVGEAQASRSERISGLRDRVQGFEGEEAERQAAWDALNARREQVAGLRDEARRDREKAAADLASAIERRRMSEKRRDVVANELQQLTLIPSNPEMLERLSDVTHSAQQAVVAVLLHVDALRTRQRDLRLHVGSANAELGGAEERRETLELERRAAVDRLNTLEIELAELRVRDEASCEALRRDADADESTALEAPRPEVDDGIDLGERLDSLQADLRRMGPINPLAAAEYETLAGDVSVLETQLEDLSEARNDLRRVIAALDEQMVSLFDDAFAEIAAYYQENFALVFPGGTGSLAMSEEGDALSAGVDVRAQPAGKKVGRLSLLSGGERSLAALAFLFAVFRARPGPFYVLDEVEAALDDANLHRFLRLVETLRRDVQLVIITHQQQTMGAADVLYGVTMEPGESSKVLSKRMSPVTV
jgi:chromosome segregation protein